MGRRLRKTLMRWLGMMMCTALVASCSVPSDEAGPRIVVYGDSMMDWNSNTGTSTPDVLALMLGEPVRNQALTGARMTHPVNPLFDIRKQRAKGDWKVAIVNGGANDMLLECACHFCRRNMDRLISADGSTGKLPDFMRSLRADGSAVIYAGYHRPREINTPIRACGDEVDELEARVRRLMDADPMMTFVALADAFPSGDTSYYDVDRFHPSKKGSEVLAQHLHPHVLQALQVAETPTAQ